MKKRLQKFWQWDHASQLIAVVSTIPCVIEWIKGHAHPITILIIGWNLGLAAGWQFYILERRRKEVWMNRAMNRKAPDIDIDKMVNIAEHLVAARFKAGHIDPDRN